MIDEKGDAAIRQKMTAGHVQRPTLRHIGIAGKGQSRRQREERVSTHATKYEEADDNDGCNQQGTLYLLMQFRFLRLVLLQWLRDMLQRRCRLLSKRLRRVL